MIKKRYIFIPFIVLSIGVLVIGAIGYYILFLRHVSGDELVFAATEVGTPEGPAAAKNIGPSGGTLASPDGRLILTVPKDAVADSTQFSIQPITSTVTYGIGQGYRLEPSGKTFRSPLQLTIHYGDGDLEGTSAAAMQLAYQEKDGSWHAQTSSKADEAAKTLTVSTTHFSDWLLLRTIGISPLKATVLVGETVYIKIDSCPDRDPIQKYNIWKYFFGHDCRMVSTGNSTWALNGAGTLTNTDNSSGIVYTAPPVKPADPLARVMVDIDIPIRDPDSGEVRTYPRKFESLIKIVDRGYRVSGQDGPVSYSGVVCDLAKPFSVTTTMGPVTFSTKFEPESASSGVATWGTTYGAHGMGNGPYTITADGAGYKITLHMTSSLTLAGKEAGGSGDAHIVLTPLEGNECSGN